MRSLLFWSLFPFVLPQAILVKKNAPRFRSARGPTSGAVGTGKTLQLVAIGDSIISGVGAPTLDKALAGQTAATLADTLDANIHWTALGSTGANTKKILDRLVPRLPDHPVDFFLISAGVNDVTSLATVANWKEDLQDLLQAIRAHSPNAILAVAGIPPLRGFPLLPQPLRALFGVRADTFDLAANQLIQDQQQVIYIPLDFEPRPELFSEDGFHPSEASYSVFGQLMGSRLAEAYNTNQK